MNEAKHSQDKKWGYTNTTRYISRVTNLNKKQKARTLYNMPSMIRNENLIIYILKAKIKSVLNMHFTCF